ncbi:MAG: hypothetical protein HYU67_01480 [Flavobacteriia bacterium]|nr:hypothetical protein [Flavobacteriia bacterium]
MTRAAIIQHTIQIINNLPEDKAIEISDFADFIAKKYNEETFLKEINNLNSTSSSFDFLNEEEELYTLKDIKENKND